MIAGRLGLQNMRALLCEARSAIAEHRLDNGHEIQFSNTKFIAESYFFFVTVK